jgi:ferredoxin
MGDAKARGASTQPCSCHAQVQAQEVSPGVQEELPGRQSRCVGAGGVRCTRPRLPPPLLRLLQRRAVARPLGRAPRLAGKLCIEVSPNSKIAWISEELCIGCGICVKVRMPACSRHGMEPGCAARPAARDGRLRMRAIACAQSHALQQAAKSSSTLGRGWGGDWQARVPAQRRHWGSSTGGGVADQMQRGPIEGVKEGVPNDGRQQHGHVTARKHSVLQLQHIARRPAPAAAPPPPPTRAHRAARACPPPARPAPPRAAQKCPFEAIMIINLPKDLEGHTTHRYGPNSFKLHRCVRRRGRRRGREAGRAAAGPARPGPDRGGRRESAPWPSSAFRAPALTRRPRPRARAAGCPCRAPGRCWAWSAPTALASRRHSRLGGACRKGRAPATGGKGRVPTSGLKDGGGVSRGSLGASAARPVEGTRSGHARAGARCSETSAAPRRRARPPPPPRRAHRRPPRRPAPPRARPPPRGRSWPASSSRTWGALRTRPTGRRSWGTSEAASCRTTSPRCWRTTSR